LPWVCFFSGDVGFSTEGYEVLDRGFEFFFCGSVKLAGLGWMVGWLVLGEGLGRLCSWVDAWGMHGRWTRGREREGAFLGFEHVY